MGLPHCNATLLGSGVRFVQCHIAGQQRVVGFLRYIATVLGTSGQWDSFRALPHC